MAQKVAAEPDAYSADGETPGDLEGIRRAAREWRERVAAPSAGRVPPRKARFSTWSDAEVPDVLTPADVPFDYLRDLGMPGAYPFTRGVQPSMYRGKLWTMRMFSGYGTPE